MITIQSGKLSIPEDERFIGFAGDNPLVTKQFAVLHRAVPGSVYTLCLRFDNGETVNVPLSAQIFGSDTLLTWNIERWNIIDSGIVTAQVKMTDGSGGVIRTDNDYFIADASVEQEPDESGYVTITELESRLAAAAAGIEAKAPYLGDDGFWRVYERYSGEFIKTDYRGDLNVDGEVSASGDDPVTGGAVAAYVGAQIESLRSEIGDIEDALAVNGHERLVLGSSGHTHCR